MLILNRYRAQLFLAILAAIYATCLLIVHSTQFLQNTNALAFGITGSNYFDSGSILFFHGSRGKGGTANVGTGIFTQPLFCIAHSSGNSTSIFELC